MRYRILKHLGGGGQGSVYLAEGVAGKVALKEVGSADLAEFEASRPKGAKAHPNLVAFMDVVTDEEVEDPDSVREAVADGPRAGGWFIVMSYLEGSPLTKYPQFKEMSPMAWWQLLSQVLDGVNHMHSHGLIHRDLKPDNIIITRAANGQPCPVVVDLGLAKRLQSDRTKIAGYTPKYAPPEYLDGALGPSYDIFQLALISFEAMYGDDDEYYDRDGGWSLQKAQRALREDNPSPFKSALADGLARNPLERPQSIWEWIKTMVGLPVAETGTRRGHRQDTSSSSTTLCPHDDFEEDPRLGKLVEDYMESDWNKEGILQVVLDEMGIFSSANSQAYKDLARKTKRGILNTLRREYPDEFIQHLWEPDGFRESTARISVSTLRAEIESEFGLPEGSVAIRRPNGDLASGLMHYGTFAKELWTTSSLDYDDQTLSKLARTIAPRYGLTDACIAFRKRQGGELYNKGTHVRKLKGEYG